MKHVRLASRMARLIGVDLAKAQKDGRLDQEEWAGIVETCRHCDWSDGCPEWMDRQTLPCKADKRCPNRARFADLARETEEA